MIFYAQLSITQRGKRTMHFLTREESNGLSLRRTFLWMLAFSIVITGLLIVMVYHAFRSFHALAEATDTYIELEKAAAVNRALSTPAEGLPPFTVSVGVSFYREPNNAQEALHEADIALYHVKDNGRSGCGFYDADMADVPV